MAYKYVWRGLEEIFKFAHLHKNGSQLCWGPFSISGDTRLRGQALLLFNPSQLR